MKKIKVGMRLRIIKMEGEESYNGKEGIVEYVDDLGQIHGSWGGCALIEEIDEIEIL